MASTSRVALAKVVIYEAFVEGQLEAPKHLARTVHDLYFEPTCEEFRSRAIWSLSNAFTSAFKELDPIPQFEATGSTKQFGWLQASATRNCSAPICSEYAPTIRIDTNEARILSRRRSQVRVTPR